MNNSEVKRNHFDNNYGKIILIILFFVFIWLPFFQQITGTFNYAKLEEKRAKAVFPQFDWQNFCTGIYFSDISKYYSDNFGFRDLLIQVNSTLNLKAFDKLTTDDLVLGKDGWLFYYITVADYQKKRLHEKEIEKIATKLENFARDLKSHDIDFYFIISPNKNTIYPEYMPEYISQPDNEESNLELLSSRLTTSEEVTYIDLRLLLNQKKEEGFQVYPANDSHWTFVGSSFVSNEIVGVISKDQGFEYNPFTLDFETYEVFDQVHGGSGDLQKLLGKFGAENLDEAAQKLPDPILPSSYHTLPKTLWYQTSFTDKLKKFNNPYFEDITYFHYQQHPMINTLNSNLQGVDIVVFEMVERWLGDLVTYEFPEIK